MKGFKIAINIILAVQLIILIALAVLWPTVFVNQGLAEISAEASESTGSAGDQLGRAIGSIFGAFFFIFIMFIICGLFIICAIVNLVMIIVYNVRKYPNIGTAISTLLLVNIVAGILMLVQRSKYLAENNQS